MSEVNRTEEPNFSFRRLADEPSYPCEGPNAIAYGLSKRELVAAQIMASICTVWPWREGPRACWAVAAADELLKELAR